MLQIILPSKYLSSFMHNKFIHSIKGKSRDETVGGGVAILINNKIKYTEKVGTCDCSGKVEICATETFFWTRRSTNYVLLQVTPSCGGAKGMETIFEHIKRKFILASDLNAHHYHWGSTKNFMEGKCIHQRLTEE
jgi:hypothetical protein